MNERARIAWLVKKVGYPIPDSIVETLRGERLLEAEGEGELNDLLTRTRRLLQMNPRLPSASRKTLPSPSERELRNLAKHDVMRRDALSEYRAKDAASRTDVKRFRADVLGGKLLTDEEAHEFLASPAASMFGVGALRAKGIDPARHQSKLIEEQGNPQESYRALVRLSRPKATLEFAPNGSRREESTVRIGGRWVHSLVWDGSVRHQLHRVAKGLRYQWRDGEGEWFILTGHVPVLSALGHTYDVHLASHGNRAVINLHIEPWVSAERVVALYRDLQKAILLNRHNRPISERRLTLFRFVTEQTGDEGEIPAWRSMLPEWNKRHPKWKYENVRNFSRDYWAGARLLLFPEYNLNTGGVRS